MRKILLISLVLLLALTFTSCSNKSKSPKVTQIVLESPATNTRETSNGYALFADKTYSAGKTFVTRGYLNNGSSYSYVNATIKAKKSLESDQKIITIGSNFKFDTNEIYTVWAEYNDLKSEPYNVCTYEANSIFDATINDKPIPTGLNLSELKKYITSISYFDENGSIKNSSSNGSDIEILLYNKETDASIIVGEGSNVTAKGYDILIAYQDSTSPFILIKEVSIYNPETDFNSIAIYNNTYAIETGLNNMQYAKRYNGTTLSGKFSPFSSDTTLSNNHYITITDGTTEKSYGPGDNVNYPFEKDVKYTVTLKVKNGDEYLTTTRNITFYK